MTRTLRASLLSLSLALAAVGRAGLTAYDFDPTGFAAAGGADVAVDFDSVADNTAFEGASLGGATFHGLGSPLLVVNGNETVTPGDSTGVYKLFPTTGNMVLSPGGKDLGFDPSVQSDSMQITLANPSKSFGLDLLYQSNDGYSLVGIELFDAAGNSLGGNGFLASNGNGNGGHDFYGYISDGAPIARVVISDNDNDNVNPDANIGIDTLRFQAVPEPTTLAAMGLGALTFLRRRK